MRLLLDTHTFLWWLDGDKKLSPKARKEISNESHDVLVSAASAWEVATKFRLGKLPGAEAVAKEFGRCVVEQGFIALPISIRHAEYAGLLITDHRDPFDRMLIAQALLERASLVSNEVLFDQFGVERFW